jgi:hypothetical protein
MEHMKMYLRATDIEDAKWMELMSQDHVQCRAFILATLRSKVTLRE